MLVWKPEKVLTERPPLTVYWGSENPVVAQCHVCEHVERWIVRERDQMQLRWGRIRIQIRGEDWWDTQTYPDNHLCSILPTRIGDGWELRIGTIDGAVICNPANKLVQRVIAKFPEDYDGSFLDVLVLSTAPIPASSWESVLSRL